MWRWGTGRRCENKRELFGMWKGKMETERVTEVGWASLAHTCNPSYLNNEIWRIKV
jgi:hypothetical protein